MDKTNFFHKFCTVAAMTMLGLGASVVSATAECNTNAAVIIKNLSGAWRGTGTVTPIGGSKDRISCRVNYNGDNSNIGLKISCAASDYKIEASAKVQCDDSTLSGSWTEKIANNTGSVSGKIDGQRMDFDINGPNFQGRIDIRVASAARHSLTITQFDPAAGRQVPVASVALTH